MKTNPNDSINSFHGDTYTSVDGYTTSNYFNAGLTKREYFAAMAMQGIQAANVNNGFQNGINVKAVAIMAVTQADMLIEELNREITTHKAD